MQLPTNTELNILSPDEVEDGWILLFDGATLNGWEPESPGSWKVEDGTLTVNVGPSAGGMLRTTTTYSDFSMTIDFWTEKHDSNSGVFIRCTPSASGTEGPTCYEVNISDASHAFPTGSLVNVQSTLPDFRADTSTKWNTLEITASGNHFLVKLNGRTTVNARDEKLTAGTIALQARGTDLLRFRNIKLRPLTGP